MAWGTGQYMGTLRGAIVRRSALRCRLLAPGFRMGGQALARNKKKKARSDRWLSLPPLNAPACTWLPSALWGPYRRSAAGLHDKQFLVGECNAAEGSRQIGCVPWEDAMAPAAGLSVVVRGSRSQRGTWCWPPSWRVGVRRLSAAGPLHLVRTCLQGPGRCGPGASAPGPPLFEHSAAHVELKLRRGIQLFN